MEWSKKQTLELIELLRVHESLWNVKNEMYKDRLKRKDALAAIAMQMDISVNDVDKKITNLKNQFNREVNKIKNKSGCGTDDVCVSPWYAFKALSFLKNNNLPKPTSISEEQNDIESNLQNPPLIEDHDIPSVSETSDVSITEKKGVKRVKPSNDRQKETLLKEAYDSVIKCPAKDEFDVFGEFIAYELRGVVDKRNILVLKKQIQDLIYLTKFNEINDVSVSSRSPESQERLSDRDESETRDDIGHVVKIEK